MFERRRSLTSLAIGVALVATTVGAAAGQSDEQLALLTEDAGVIAKSTGLGKGLVLDRLVASDRLEADLATLERNYSGYAGHRWDGDALVLMFKGSIPSSNVSQIREKSNVPVRTEHVKYSLVDHERRALDAIDALRAEGVEGQDIFVSVDLGTGEVNVAVNASGSSRRTTLRSVVERRLGSDSVNVEFAGKAPFRTQEAYGGGQFRLWVSQVCTVGFSVEKNGDGGVSGAGHCTDEGYNYFNQATGAQHNVTPRWRRPATQWGDFGWWETDGAERPRFFKDHSHNWNSVTGVKQNILGIDDVVRGYGNVVGKYEGKVKKLGFTGDGAGKLVCLDKAYTLDGDSGGPIFNGGSAIGIHAGLGFWNGKDRSCFSQARFIDDALGVTIRKE